ncbi:hypothetical protein C6383_28965 [Pseudomonas syringae pv. actinidiae]|nr:hypothetical protein BUE60_28715 [Pseudomonas syringae pv. actinidiae]PBK47728.1 hypothetical protein BUE61_28405 [Pseudomonas syringae pv. actinidiae]RJX52798.1 hypothetical protein C6383_28965 [Pseudomonas syringae pv. actinidiae]
MPYMACMKVLLYRYGMALTRNDKQFKDAGADLSAICSRMKIAKCCIQCIHRDFARHACLRV